VGEQRWLRLEEKGELSGMEKGGGLLFTG